MRKRFTTAPVETTVYDMLSRKVSTGVITNWGSIAYQTRSDLEEISDVVEKKHVKCGRVRRLAMKPVRHDKWTAINSSSSAWVYSSADHLYEERINPLEVLEAGFYGAGLPHPSGSLSDAAYISALSHCEPVGTGHYDRWLKCKPTMTTRANLGVFLAELRDFTRMWDFIPQKHLLLKGIRQRDMSWRRIQDWYASVKKHGDSKIAYANNQHLNYNFGWKPFLSDIKRCWGGLATYEERLRKFVFQQEQVLHQTARSSPRQVSETSEIQSAWTRYKVIQKWDLTEKHASAFDFSYHIPNFSESELRWRAMLDTVGLNPTPSTFWALTPWSFVVDWFYDVGGMIRSHENDWLQPWIFIHQACFSRKAHGLYEVSIGQYPTYGSGIYPGIKLHFSQYIRSVGLPNFSAVTDPLDADKIRLGVSLLASLFLK